MNVYLCTQAVISLMKQTGANEFYEQFSDLPIPRFHTLKTALTAHLGTHLSDAFMCRLKREHFLQCAPIVYNNVYLINSGVYGYVLVYDALLCKRMEYFKTRLLVKIFYTVALHIAR